MYTAGGLEYGRGPGLGLCPLMMRIPERTVSIPSSHCRSLLGVARGLGSSEPDGALANRRVPNLTSNLNRDEIGKRVQRTTGDSDSIGRA